MGVLRRHSKNSRLLVERFDRALAAVTQAGKRIEDASQKEHSSYKLAQRIDPETIAKIVQDYQDGMTSPAIGKQYGINKGSVIRLLREAGVPVRNQPLDERHVAEAIALYRSGLSLARVGEKLQVDPGTVRRTLIARGIARRDSHGREC